MWVTAALAAIKRVDRVLGTGHEEFLPQALRGFDGRLAGSFGLPLYAADAAPGVPLDTSRGCGNSHFCCFVPELWPRRGDEW